MGQAIEEKSIFPSQKGTVPNNPAEDLKQALADKPHIKFIRLQWQDYTGILRLRIVVVEHFRALISARKTVHAPTVTLQCILDNTVVPWVDPTGAHLLIPDYSSFRALPGQPQYAVI